MKTKNQSMDSEGSFSKLVPVILKKGIENVNLSMFTDETRNQILEAVGDEYVKRGATKEDCLQIILFTDYLIRLFSGLYDDNVLKN